MESGRVLRALAIVLVLASPTVLLAGGESTCSPFQAQTGTCPTITPAPSPTGGAIDLLGEEHFPGSTLDPSSVYFDPDTVDDPNADCAYVINGSCYLGPRERPEPITPVTLTDIASFRPVPSVNNMEPNGWTIAGLDTNFYATGGAQTKDGTLLGQPASVRFTPVAWYWSYGDGASASRPFPGGTWAAQGIREFDPTGTSHVYREYGTYYIDLDVDYAAEYRFAGGPWTPIAGVLTLPANQLMITVGNAKTVLVERECTKNPAGPGC